MLSCDAGLKLAVASGAVGEEGDSLPSGDQCGWDAVHIPGRTVGVGDGVGRKDAVLVMSGTIRRGEGGQVEFGAVCATDGPGHSVAVGRDGSRDRRAYPAQVCPEAMDPGIGELREWLERSGQKAAEGGANYEPRQPIAVRVAATRTRGSRKFILERLALEQNAMQAWNSCRKRCLTPASATLVLLVGSA